MRRLTCFHNSGPLHRVDKTRASVVEPYGSDKSPSGELGNDVSPEPQRPRAERSAASTRRPHERGVKNSPTLSKAHWDRLDILVNSGVSSGYRGQRPYGQKIGPSSDSLFEAENSLFGRNNSLFRQKNSLFHCVGNCAASD
jgi:hypothetical protein